MNVKDFLSAVTEGDISKIKDLLKKDASLAGATDEKGVSAILLAVYFRKKGVVDLLLASGLELNIFEAAALGQTSRVKTLLARTPTLVNDYSADGFPPLGLATFFGHKETAALLINSGAQVDAVAKNDMKVRALHAAAAARQIEIARMLIERGADVNAQQQAGFTPLHEASASGQVEFVELLLAHGADINAKTDIGKTPLALAVELGQAGTIALLRKHGAQE